MKLKSIIKTPIAVFLTLLIVLAIFSIQGLYKLIKLMGPDGMPKFIRTIIAAGQPKSNPIKHDSDATVN